MNITDRPGIVQRKDFIATGFYYLILLPISVTAWGSADLFMSRSPSSIMPISTTTSDPRESEYVPIGSNELAR